VVRRLERAQGHQRTFQDGLEIEWHRCQT
jgi:hypothetical protein